MQIFSGDAGGIGGHLLRCAAGHDASAALAAAGAKVHEIVGVADHIQIVLNDHHSGSAVNETLEHAQQGTHIQRVQADGGLVEYKHGVGLPFAHLAGELEPLGLPARKAGRGLAQSQVAQPQAGKGLQPAGHQLEVGTGGKGFVHAHLHQAGQALGLGAVLPGAVEGGGILLVAGAAAVRAGDLHIRQELDVQADGAGAVAAGTAQAARVVGEIARLVALLPGKGGAGVDLAQFVVDIGIGGHRGPHVDADGRCVNELDLRNARCSDAFHMGGQSFALGGGLQRGDQAFQHQRGLAGTGHAGHRDEPPLGQPDFQRLDGVDGPGAQGDGAQRKELRFRGAGAG